MTPRLDYVPRLVEANRAYRVAAPVDLSGTSRFWVPGNVVTDQGQEGACCGHGVVNEAIASPVRRNDNGMNRYPDVANALAYDVYRAAQRIDAWEGESYDGTSVRAGMLVGRERGWWTGFRWAFNMTELRAALESGPVVIGVEWRSGMYQTVDRDLVVRGDVVGGHCLLVTGYSARTHSYRLRNSWGLSFGVRGTCYITDTDLDRILFQAGGEAVVPTGRSL